ncbi:helix-turn-helix domain-containing protein [Methylorubrum populi]|uniref:Helix-turn-helix domain-containing protein n=1 Tax=Methylorubrum populi TaxID=223967 RepID=A0A833J7N6_9HYPH|nr:helix-turn-helix domain-containing protein [Methylorubrum populi]KAB7786002.1 hypothetical protein F8B43_1403 [Methylorubrum populi]
MTTPEANQEAKPAGRKPVREPKPAPTPIAYRPGDAARVLGVSRATIYKMMTDGKLEARHLGGATLIARAELVRVFESAPLTPHTKFARSNAE